MAQYYIKFILFLVLLINFLSLSFAFSMPPELDITISESLIKVGEDFSFSCMAVKGDNDLSNISVIFDGNIYSNSCSANSCTYADSITANSVGTEKIRAKVYDSSGAFAVNEAWISVVACFTGDSDSRSCGTTDVGICELGTQERSCNSDYTWNSFNSCSGAINPETEICNGLDDDCDGQTDENEVCGPDCVEDWTLDNNSCQIDDTILVFYSDDNSCDTTDDLPVDHETLDSCDYCTQNWILNNSWSLCINDSQSRNYVDDNSCYQTTAIANDLLGKPLDETRVCGISADLDGDGFNGSLDCNDYNSSIFPGANESYNNIDMNCVNDVPEFFTLSDFIVNITVADIYDLNLNYDDVDGDNLILSFNEAFINSSGFVISSLVPDYGQYNITATISDGSLTDTLNFTLNILTNNTKPILTTIGNKNVSENSWLNFTIIATDVDGDNLTYGISGEPTGVLFNTINGEFSWKPLFNQSGIYNILFTVADDETTVSEMINIEVFDTNTAPVLSLIGNKIINENVFLNFDINATDIDNDTLIYSALGIPIGATLNATSGLFEWTPTFEDAGNHIINFSVSDGEYIDNEVITITVNNINNPPILLAIGNRTINENSTLIIDINATDINGDSLLYSQFNMPAGATLNVTSGLFEWSTDFDSLGIYNITFLVSDGEFSDSEVIIIEVTNVNRAPVLNLISDIEVNETDLVNISATATDVDGDNLTYSYSSPINNSGEWQTNYSNSGVYNIEIIVTDGDLSDSQNITLTVNNVNRAPVLENIGNYVINESETLSFTLNVSDIDGDSLTIAANNLPVGASFNNVSGLFVWTPNFIQSGVHNINFSVSDGNDVDYEIVTITVNDVNNAPVLTAVGNKTVNENSLLTFSLFANDINGDNLTFSGIGLPDGSSLDAVSGLFIWNTNFSNSGNHSINFSVTDGNLNDSEVIIIEVTNVNRAPVLNLISDIEVNETDLVNISATATDVDGDNLTYSYSSPINNSGEWQTNYSNAGIYNIEIIVTDGDLNDSQNITLTVNNVNRAPVLTAIGNKTVNENSILTFSISGTDPDSDSLIYTAENLPIGASLDNNSGLFVWTPTFDDSGIYNVTFFVNDGDLNDSEIIFITVNHINRAPMIASINDIIVNETDLVNVNVIASDTDGDNLTYIFGSPLNATGEWLTNYSSTGVYNTYAIVNDGNLNSSTINFTITVIDVNRAPVLAAIGNKTVNENTLLNFTVSGTDADGDDLTLGLVGGVPADASYNITSGVFSWIPNYLDSGNYSVEFSLTDNRSLSDSEVINIEVLNVNVIPVIENFVLNNSNISEGESLNIALNLSNIYDGISSYNWSIKDLNNNTVYTSNNTNINYTFMLNGTYNISIEVIDSDGSSVNNSINIDVANLGTFALSSSFPTTGVEDLTVDFFAVATIGNAPFTYDWSLGNGTFITSNNFGSYNFIQNGTYDIVLTVEDVDGDVYINSTTITILDSVPDVSILSNNLSSVLENTIINFTSNVLAYDGISSYGWFVDDVLNSTTENMSYYFENNGTYDITLNVTDNDGSITTSSLLFVVGDTNPIANFSLAGSLAEGEIITFSDESSSYDSIASYFWDFGDLTNSSLTNPTHTYTHNGSYNLSLTIVDSDGSNDTISQIIDISNVEVNFDFNSNLISGDESLDIDFNISDIGGNSPFSYFIDFGDLTNSSLANVSHTFTTFGIYNVTATVTDIDGDSKTENIVITVYDAIAPSFSNISENIANGSEYIDNLEYIFNSTWIDNDGVEDVYIVFDGITFTNISNIGNIYSFNISDLDAGVHNYTWYANDSRGNINVSGINYYIINKTNPVLSFTIDAVSSDVLVEENIGVVVVGSSNSVEGNISLYINDTLNVSGLNINEILNLSDGIYNLSLKYPSTANYNAVDVSYIMTVYPLFTYDLELSDLIVIGNNDVNSNVSIVFNITNNGNVMSSSIVKLFVADIEIDNLSIINLDANTTVQMNFNYTLPNIEIDNLEFEVKIENISEESNLVNNIDSYFVDVIGTHDLSVDSLVIDSSTIYLNDQININSNITNNGNINESFIIKFKVDGNEVGSQNLNLTPTQTSEINFIWNASIVDSHSLSIEIVPVIDEINLSNNVITEFRRVFSVVDNIDLSFVSVDNFPSNITSTGSTFYVWARIENLANVGENFEDLEFTLDVDGLLIIASQDGSGNNIRSIDINGNEVTSYWWEVAAGGSVADYNMSILVGNVGDSLNIVREVSVE